MFIFAQRSTSLYIRKIDYCQFFMHAIIDFNIAISKQRLLRQRQGHQWGQILVIFLKANVIYHIIDYKVLGRCLICFHLRIE